MQEQNLILIAYKNKLLLSTNDSPFEKKEWAFVGEKGKWSTSRIKSAISILKNVTKLQFPAIEKMQLSDVKGDYVFYLKLTDKNVNSIVRKDGERLEFYTLREAEKLNLAASTNNFLNTFKTEITSFLSE